MRRLFLVALLAACENATEPPPAEEQLAITLSGEVDVSGANTWLRDGTRELRCNSEVQAKRSRGGCGWREATKTNQPLHS